MVENDKLAILLEWFKDNKVSWDNTKIDVRAVGNGFGVFALKDCPENETLVKIPKSCILSAKSTGVSNILEDEAIEGGAALSIAVMYELAQGTESPWYGYLQALPFSEDLPIFWSEAEKMLFQGTELEDVVFNDQNDLNDDYETVVMPLVEKYPYIFPKDKFTLELFCRISTLVSSRAFEVDTYHETAMVPFADIFNHRSGDEDVHFQTDFDVCEACGELEYCQHQYAEYLEHGSDDEDEDEWSDVEGDGDDDMEDAASVEEDEEQENKEEEDEALQDLEELENAKVDFWKDEEEDDDENKDTCDMVLDKPVKAGAEVFNTYGPLPNVILLNKYGFCHDDNQNDYISVAQDNVFSTCIETVRDELFGTGQASEEVIEQIVERVRERFEFFLTNEPILCPKEDDDEEEDDEDEDDEDEEHDEEEHEHDHDGCCGSEDNDEEHDHGCCEDDGCCSGGEDRSPPYFANVEGLYEDNLICLLHIVFVDEKLFAKFQENIEEALKYFEQLAKDSEEGTKKKNADLIETKKMVYTVCKRLSELRRQDYLDASGRWVPIEEDIQKRDNETSNKRQYYALTCYISEKKIVQRSIEYYDSRIKACELDAKSASKKKQKSRK